MGKIEWGSEPEFFGPRHAHREARLRSALGRCPSGPARHLECAAGVGSLAVSLARQGRTVAAVDTSVQSLAVVRRRAIAAGLAGQVLPVVGDITRLPFADSSFASATTAETLEHVPDHAAAAGELARVLAPGGCLAGTVPAGPEQWSAWDDWAGHLRRYTPPAMAALLRGAGLEPRVTRWGWPVLRAYDALFLLRVNRRRLDNPGTVDQDPALRTVAGLGRRRWLVRCVQAAFALDRPFDGLPWGVGLLFSARKPVQGSRSRIT